MLQRLALDWSCSSGTASKAAVRGMGGSQDFRGSAWLVPPLKPRSVCACAVPSYGEGAGHQKDAFLMDLMRAVQDGTMTPDEGVHLMQTHSQQGKQEVGFSSLLHGGSTLPDIVVGSGKTPQQIADCMASLSAKQGDVVAVRIVPGVYAAVRKLLPGVEYHAGGQTLTLRTSSEDAIHNPPRLPGSIAILTGGPEDSIVAEECRLVAEHLGCYCFKVKNIKSSDLQTILPNFEAIRSAAIIVVVSGSDGALPSVISGIADALVISIPSGSGLSSSFGGTSAMLGCLTSLLQGVTFVGIDDGVAAAVSAARILKSVNKISDMKNSPSSKQDPKGKGIISNSTHTPNGTDERDSDSLQSTVNGSGMEQLTNGIHDEALEALSHASRLATSLNGNGARNGSKDTSENV